MPSRRPPRPTTTTTTATATVTRAVGRAVVVLVTLTTALIAMPGGPALAARPGAHRDDTRVLANCRTPTYEPTRIIIACGDYNEFVTIRHYDSWTADQATGRGYLHVNRCLPDCAHGDFVRFPATFRLHGTAPGADGGQVFRRLEMTFERHGRTRHSTAVLATRRL